MAFQGCRVPVCVRCAVMAGFVAAAAFPFPVRNCFCGICHYRIRHDTTRLPRVESTFSRCVMMNSLAIEKCRVLLVQRVQSCPKKGRVHKTTGTVSRFRPLFRPGLPTKQRRSRRHATRTAWSTTSLTSATRGTHPGPRAQPLPAPCGWPHCSHLDEYRPTGPIVLPTCAGSRPSSPSAQHRRDAPLSRTPAPGGADS